MNTVKKGNDFESNAFELISEKLKNGYFGLDPNCCKLFRQKGYHSSVRNKMIKFDITIEVWPPNATNYSFLYIIECKNYSKKVPVDDVEEFIFKVSQVSNYGYFVKAAFITNTGFQSGAYELANNTRTMLMIVNDENNLNIVLHKDERLSNNHINISSECIFEKFLKYTFNHKEVSGLEYLSKENIKEKVIDFINTVDKDSYDKALPIKIEKIKQYLKKTENIKFETNKNIGSKNQKKTLGYCDFHNNIIKVDKSLKNNNRFSFVLYHEIAHYILHKNLQIEQTIYDDFTDSQFDPISGKYIFDNEKNWIEWQANEFASNLILPDSSIIYRLYYFQEKRGIAPEKRGYILYDDQKINIDDFETIIDNLSFFFNTTKTSIILKLQSLNLIKYSKVFSNYNLKNTNYLE